MDANMREMALRIVNGLDEDILKPVGKQMSEKSKTSLLSITERCCAALIDFLSQDRLHNSCLRYSGNGASLCSDGVDYEVREVIDLFSYQIIDSLDDILFDKKQKISGDWQHEEQIGFMMNDTDWYRADAMIKDSVKQITCAIAGV